jgi:hypothetical protein
MHVLMPALTPVSQVPVPKEHRFTCMCRHLRTIFFLKSLFHPNPWGWKWNTSPPTYENRFFLPPELSKTDKSPLKQF